MCLHKIKWFKYCYDIPILQFTHPVSYWFLTLIIIFNINYSPPCYQMVQNITINSIERQYVNANKTEYMCYNQTGDISTLHGTRLKLVDKFTYLGSSIASTEKDIGTRLTKAWTAINRLSIILKSDLTDKMKRSFFQAAVVSILLYGCTTWTLTNGSRRS